MSAPVWANIFAGDQSWQKYRPNDALIWPPPVQNAFRRHSLMNRGLIVVFNKFGQRINNRAGLAPPTPRDLSRFGLR
jgi:hypothetical protein